MSDGENDNISTMNKLFKKQTTKTATKTATKTNTKTNTKTATKELTLVDQNKINNKAVDKNGKYQLVIVESPNKIKKLESFLGSGYVVIASYGHIIDLHPKKMSVDVNNSFSPEYYIMDGAAKFQSKVQVVKDIIAKSAKASRVIFASDKDREGEMIAWSYKTVLGIDDNSYDRITFGSITKDEIKKAIKNPRKINDDIVASQKTRRILDRLVGFKISPILNQVLGTGDLSAGRVQSIVVKLICEKEDEINNFFEGDNASYFKIGGNFKLNEADFQNVKCDLVSLTTTSNDENTDEIKTIKKKIIKIMKIDYLMKVKLMKMEMKQMN